MIAIDINSDLGEGYGPWSMSEDAKMLAIVTSANIACGGHASDPETMFRTLEYARDAGVAIGAHPGFKDREGFGRRRISMSPDEIGRMCVAQIGALMGIASLVGVTVRYVKPHGALANLAAQDRKVADAITRAVQRLDPDLAVLAISGTQSERAARALGLRVYSEVFADRGYLTSGQLVPRNQDGAIIHDVQVATERLLTFLKTGLMPVVDGDPIPLKAESVCVHGDTPGAVVMAREIRRRLVADGIKIASFIPEGGPA